MKGKRYTTETKIRILREAQSRDKTIQDVCRERQISEQTYHRWKRELGMLEINQAKQLKELQRENARLKRMLADEMLGREACFRGSMYGTSGLPAYWADLKRDSKNISPKQVKIGYWILCTPVY